MIDVRNIDGSVIKTVDLNDNARSYDEVMALCYRSLSWTDEKMYNIPEGSYIEIDGEIYRLLEPYTPEYNNEASYTYAPKFYDKIALWSKKPLFLITDSGMETDWEDTAYPGQFMEIVVRAIKELVGETYTYSVDASIAQEKMEYISFQNVSIFDGLNTIADKFGTEWWIEGNVIHLSKCQYGSPVVLEVGKNVGLPSVTYNKDGYFTRFYAFGSTRNITQDYDGGNLTNSIVNKRLTLNQSVYPGGYIDIRDGLKKDEIFIKSIIFDDIYPSSKLTISSVRGQLKDYLDESGNKIQVGEIDGEPVYKQYTIWYFKIEGFELNNTTYDKDDNPEGMLLPGLNLSVSFESGQLNGRDFELSYNSESKEYEIHFKEENGIITPGSVSLIPADGDEIILYNIRMPQEYITSAQEELAQALINEIEAKYSGNRNSYTFDSYPVDFFESKIDLKVGMSITFRFNGGELSTRVQKVEKNLSLIYEQSITIGNEKIKKSSQEIKEEIVDAKQNIDIVKELADLSKAINDGYGRVQQLIIESMMQYRGLWVLNQNGHPEDPTYWTVETDYTALSKKDFVAYSTEEKIQDEELPLAGYGITNRGVTSYKQGGGILVDSNGLAYIDPTYIGSGGGLDLDQLEEYLTGNNYLQKNDPVSSLLMTGYSKYSTNSAIAATDNAMVAISKLERKFDFYVTLDTTQTITGSKTFSQDIIGQRDIICKSTSEAISDAELPIASKTQLGLIKIGSGFEITADGTLNNTGTGGLTEVFWDDIKNPPTTLAGYGITASNVLTTLKTVDGSGSGLDADLLDGHSSSYFVISTSVGNVDFNSITTSGVYRYEDTTANGTTNAPSHRYGQLLVLHGGGDTIAQIAFPYEDSKNIEFRAGNPSDVGGPGSWFEWKKLAFTTDNVASASKLSPGCKIWGKAFTGENDITGSLTSVSNITMTGSINIADDFGIFKGSNWVLNSNSQGQLLLNATGSNIILGYRGTSSISFYGGVTEAGIIGSYLGSWTTERLLVNTLLGIGTPSPQAELHVIGDGLFTGDVIAKSTSTAISDAELPIASKTQLGLIKIGTGFEITADGTINNSGTGGLTEVFWDDVKMKPTTFAPSPHTHTKSQITDFPTKWAWNDITGKPTTLAGYGIKASDVLTTLKTVDGSGSGLDADLLDGHSSSYFVISTEVGNVDFNSITTSGVYRYGDTTANGSTNGPSHGWGQMLVLHGGGDTIAQIAFPYADSRNIEFRAGNPSDVGGPGSWFEWKKLAFTTDNVASASKLSPGCKIWGKAFTGENDITGSLTSVSNITMTGSINIADDFGIFKGSNWVLNSNSQGQLLLNATGSNIILGYRGTSSISFYGGVTEAGIIGSYLGSWTTERLLVNTLLGIGTPSPQAELHVIGDGLFTGDVIAKSTSSAISDSELPIASASTLGLIKVGSGFEVMADGTLNNTGTGGLTEVYWDDIKNPPKTLSGYDIKASDVLTTLKTVDGSGSGLDADLLDGLQVNAFLRNFTAGNVDFNTLTTSGVYRLSYTDSNNASNGPSGGEFSQMLVMHGGGDTIAQLVVGYSTHQVYIRSGNPSNVGGAGSWSSWYTLARTVDNVASASKLSPGCKIWGQAFTGESDVTGSLTNVGNITSSNSAFIISKSGIGPNYIMQSQDNGQLNINAHNGKTILLGYRGTSGYQFYAGTGGGDSVGSAVGLWNSDSLKVYVPMGIDVSDPLEKLHVGGSVLITGSLKFDNAFSINRNDLTGVSYIMQSQDNGQLNINAYGGNTILFGYRGTSGYQFYAGTGGGDSVGSYICKLDTDKLYLRVPLGIKTASPQAELHVIGDGLFTGDVIAKSTSTAISDAELPIASASTLGLIKVGSGLKITNGVLSVSGGSGGGSNVYWGSPTDDMVPLYVDDSYYELSRKKHKHAVSTNGTGNAVTSISFNKDTGGMILSKGSTFSLNGHTHSQYLTSHQRIYSLTIQKNGTNIGTYTPNSANKTINITVDDATADPFNGGTITNALYINIPSGGSTKPFKVRYASGNYFFLNHGGTPALMANNADSYNSNANITFNNSSVAATGFTYTGTSDMRLKDRIGDITGVLDKLAGIEAFFFRYKAEPTDIHIGVSAQEVIKVFPEVVPLIGDYYQLRYTDFLTAVSVNGIKELYALQKQTTNEIDVLKQRIAILEAENQNLWNIINEKEAA